MIRQNTQFLHYIGNLQNKIKTADYSSIVMHVQCMNDNTLSTFSGIGSPLDGELYMSDIS